VHQVGLFTKMFIRVRPLW